MKTWRLKLHWRFYQHHKNEERSIIDKWNQTYENKGWETPETVYLKGGNSVKHVMLQARPTHAQMSVEAAPLQSAQMKDPKE